MTRFLKWISVGVVAVLLGTLLVRAFSERKDPQDHDDDTIRSSSHVKIQNGFPVVILTASARQRAGITVATLQKSRRRAEATAPAKVLATQSLATFRNQYVGLQNQLEKAEIASRVAEEEYKRLNKLYVENQNVSAKAVQAAQGTLLQDQSDLATARQQLALVSAAVRQSWGSVVADWVASDSPILKRILSQQDMLVEVTIPSWQPLAKPRTVRLEMPTGDSVTASFVSAFPRVDPRLQGVSLLYLAPVRPGLVPGVNPVANFGVGKLTSGVVVPSSAVVWWQGSAWIYQENVTGHFARRPVPTDTPVGGGYFVKAVIVAGNRIVVRGAQALLSEEFRSQIQPED